MRDGVDTAGYCRRRRQASLLLAMSLNDGSMIFADYALIVTG